MDEKKEEIVTEEVTKVEAKPSKKSCKKIILPIVGVLVVALLAVGGFFAYRIFKNSDPAKLSSDAIRGLKGTIKDIKDENPGLTKIVEGNDPYEVNTKVTLDLPEDLGKYTANLLAQVDSKNEMFKLSLNAKNGKETLIDLDLLLDKTMLYFTLPDSMKSWYKADATEFLEEFKTELSEMNTKSLDKISKYDFNKVIDYLADAVDDTLDKDDFKKSSDEITVNGKDIKVNKYTADITYKDAAKVLSSFLNSVSKDKELIEIIADLTGEDKEDVKSAITDAIKEIKEADYENDVMFTYSVYVSKLGEVIGYGFEVNGFEITICEKGNVTEIVLSMNGIAFTIDIEEKGDHHVVITAGTLGYSLVIDIEDEIDTIKKNKEYKETLTVKISLTGIGVDETAKLVVESTTKKIDSITKVKDAIDVEKMTSAEQYTFQKEVEKSSLYKTIMSLAELMEQYEGMLPTTSSNISY